MCDATGDRPPVSADDRGLTRVQRIAYVFALVAFSFALSLVSTAGGNPNDVSLTVLSPTSSTVSGNVTWSVAPSGSVTVDHITFRIDGGPVAWTEWYSPYQFNGDPNGQLDTRQLADGQHTLTAASYDAQGTMLASASTAVTVANAPSSPPSPAPSPAPAPPPATVPSPGPSFSLATLSPTTTTVSGRILWVVSPSDDSQVDHIDFKIDGAGKSWTEWYSPYQYNGDPSGQLDTTRLADGQHTLAAVAVDRSGNVLGTSTTTITVANASSPAPTPTPTTTSASTTTSSSVTTPAPPPTTTSASTPPPTSPSSTLGTSLPSRLPQSSGKGGTYYVDGSSGSDSNSGSAAAPWRTIDRALKSVPATGSKIEVAPGTYYASGTGYAFTFARSASIDDPITLEAQVPGTVTIANGNPSNWTIGAWIHDASGLRVRNITFHVLAAVGQGADELLIENSNRIEIDHCTFLSTGSQGVIVRGGDSNAAAEDVWIVNNTFRPDAGDPTAQGTGNAWSPSDYFGSAGSHWIYAGQHGSDASADLASGSERLVIANNVFTGSTAGDDIQLGPQARNGYVVNNTFYGNHAMQLLGSSARYVGNAVSLYSDGSPYATGNNLVANNIFVDIDGHAVYGCCSSPQTGNVVQGNLSYGLRNGSGWQGPTSQDYLSWYESSSTTLFSTGAGNRPNANPLLASPGSYDFHLQAGSPAIGAAMPAYTPPTDMAGNPRPAAPDLGAIQH
jgi:pectate lyase